jgi:hypothetical protein
MQILFTAPFPIGIPRGNRHIVQRNNSPSRVTLSHQTESHEDNNDTKSLADLLRPSKDAQSSQLSGTDLGKEFLLLDLPCRTNTAL